MNWWPFPKRSAQMEHILDRLDDPLWRYPIVRTPSTAASHLSRHGAEQRRDKIVTKAKAIAERLERPDLVERLTR
jgi:hypothetical protein